MADLRTRVGIVGAGPAGLSLALLLERRGIDSIVLERRDRGYVEGRVRAGLLEQNTVDLMRELGVAGRLDEQGLPHDGVYLRWQGQTLHIPMTGLTGRTITIYGQQQVVGDLIDACGERGIEVRFEVEDVAVHGLDGEPSISFRDSGGEATIDCDLIAGCDGFHGVCRPSIPDGVLSEHEYVYPFGWLGILAEAAPTTDELIYGWHERGFSLYSMRSPEISRLYLQVPAEEDIADWPDERIWAELQARLGVDGWRVGEGPIFDKGITPMRSFVVEPMQYGKLFLAGDSAHIVPPTGAKGLNLAVNDVRLLAAAVAAHYAGDDALLERYSENALRRVWRAQDFSNFMTQLLHRLDDGDPFQARLQLSRLEQLKRSEAARRNLAENYVGLPAADDF
ncbi:MAG TPA: 4-hydroxybenzoate 3-monooxygenase [Solirubrobacterales bacterium]|nr:4-hydroxybenzoate 3-monooxygenase [Solirubrobacterales bacterium]